MPGAPSSVLAPSSKARSPSTKPKEPQNTEAKTADALPKRDILRISEHKRWKLECFNYTSGDVGLLRSRHYAGDS